MAGTHNEISGTVEGTVIQARDVTLSTSAPVRGPVWLVPEPERELVDRAEIDRVVRRLGGGGGLVGVVGPGGFGKTTLVAQVCVRMRDRFPGGVLWVTLGEHVPDAVLADKINDLSEVVGGHRPRLTDPALAGHQLGRLLAERPPTLLVVDDVWSASRLSPFPVVPRLVTTRSRGALPAGAEVVQLASMNARESNALLTTGVDGLTSTARLERLTGRWPILLSLVNSAIRHAVADGSSPDAAAELVAGQLLLDGPDSLDLDSADRRDRAVRATIEASVRRLDETDRDRFRQLGIFAEDVDIPIEVAGLLWDLSPTATRRLCRKLVDASLVTNAPDAVRLHDVLRTYVRQALGPERITALNATMTERLRAEAPADWAGARHYTRRHLAGHAAVAGLLDPLLTDAGFLLAADQPELLAVLGAAASPRARTAAGVYQRVAHHLRDRPAEERPAYLELAAFRAGDRELAVAATALVTEAPWYCASMVWDPELPHAVLTRHSSAVAILEIAELPDGEVWVFSVDSAGAVRITDVVGNKAVEPPWLDSLQGCDQLVCVQLANGEVVLVICKPGWDVVARNLVTGRIAVWREDPAIVVEERNDPWDCNPLDDPGWPDSGPPDEPHDLVEEAEDPWDDDRISPAAAGDGDDVPRFEDLTERAQAIAWADTPHGPVVSILFGNYFVLTWEVATNRLVGPPLTSSEWRFDCGLDVEWRTDGTFVVTVADSSPLYAVSRWNEVWDARTGRQIAANPIEPQPDYSITNDPSVPFDALLTTLERPDARTTLPNGREVRAYREEGTIRLWDPATPQELGPAVDAHTGAVSALISGRLGDGRVIVVSGGKADGDVRLWDLSTLTTDSPNVTRIGRVERIVTAGRFTVSAHSDPDGWSGPVRLWDNGKATATLSWSSRNDTDAAGVANDSGAALLLTSGWREINVWDLTAGNLGKISPQSLPPLTHNLTALTATALHDGRLVTIAATEAPAVHAFDLDTRVPLWTVRDCGATALGTTGQDGRTVVLCASEDREIHTFDAATGERTGSPLGAPWTRVDDHPPRFITGWPDGDGMFVVAGAWLLVWDLVSGRPITWRTEGTTTHHAPVCFSAPDGTRFVATAHRSQVRCWRLEPIPPDERSSLTEPAEATERAWPRSLVWKLPRWHVRDSAEAPRIPADPGLDARWPEGLDSFTPTARLVLAWKVDLDLTVTTLAAAEDGSVLAGTRRGFVRLRTASGG